MKKVNKKKGFTLAELLVVIAILAILIAIAVPIFGGAMDNAKQTAIDANARSIKSAAMVKIMKDDIGKGTGTNGGWVATATVGTDGSITGLTVNAEPDANKGDVPPSDGGVTGSYTVYLRPTDLG